MLTIILHSIVPCDARRRSLCLLNYSRRPCHIVYHSLLHSPLHTTSYILDYSIIYSFPYPIHSLLAIALPYLHIMYNICIRYTTILALYIQKLYILFPLTIADIQGICIFFYKKLAFYENKNILVSSHRERQTSTRLPIYLFSYDRHPLTSQFQKSFDSKSTCVTTKNKFSFDLIIKKNIILSQLASHSYTLQAKKKMIRIAYRTTVRPL